MKKKIVALLIASTVITGASQIVYGADNTEISDTKEANKAINPEQSGEQNSKSVAEENTSTKEETSNNENNVKEASGEKNQSLQNNIKENQRVEDKKQQEINEFKKYLLENNINLSGFYYDTEIDENSLPTIVRVGDEGKIIKKFKDGSIDNIKGDVNYSVGTEHDFTGSDILSVDENGNWKALKAGQGYLYETPLNNNNVSDEALWNIINSLKNEGKTITDYIAPKKGNTPNNLLEVFRKYKVNVFPQNYKDPNVFKDGVNSGQSKVEPKDIVKSSAIVSQQAPKQVINNSSTLSNNPKTNDSTNILGSGLLTLISALGFLVAFRKK